MAKILLVEDNEMNRDMLSRRLTKRGFDVSIAVDGQAGVDMARSEIPDLILLDMSLPVMDGWTAAGHLKGDGGHQQPSRSSRSPPTRWPATAKRPWRPAATTTTPSRSTSSACSAKIDATSSLTS